MTENGDFWSVRAAKMVVMCVGRVRFSFVFFCVGWARDEDWIFAGSVAMRFSNG